MAGNTAMSIPTYVLDLRSTESFVALAGATVTGTTNTMIDGDVGLSPSAGSYVTGIDATNVTGSLYVVDASGPAGSLIDAILLQTAKSDLTIAYNDAAGRTPVPTGTFLNPNGGNIGTLNLVPGLYKFTSTCMITGSDVTLTGGPNDVWIFQIASDLVLGDGISVILAGGAQAANVFWQVGSSATLGTYSTFKGTILADQSVSLDVGATIEGRALAFSAAVTMNDGVTGTKPVLIVPTSPIFSADSTQIRFGDVINDNIKKDSVTVTNTGTADLVISSVTSSNSLFTVMPTDSEIAPGESLKFYVTFSPLNSGLQSGYIYFNHNDPGKRDSIWVDGTGVSEVGPEFSANSQILDFGKVNIGTSKLDSVIVSNIGTADLDISSVTSSNALFTVTPIETLIAPEKSLKFKVTFSPLISGTHNGYIYFNHNDPDKIDSIQVIGTGISDLDPVFSVSSRILHFGKVDNGLSKLDSVVVSNTGTATLEISTVTSSNPLFTITPTELLIPAGTSWKFYITFSPVNLGLQSGVIYFNHNDPGKRDSVLVDGEGVKGSSVETAANENLELLKNYPNPFSSLTMIQYNIDISGFVSLTVTDILGNEVVSLVNGFRSAGLHTVSFHAEGDYQSMATGIYYYTLKVGSSLLTKQMIYVK
ncbi:MAG: ice-binding family protein [Candidatus Kapabacteria bacterium]|nr:ice-binding family protein [Candidatus Kapabacteria bacterium]